MHVVYVAPYYNDGLAATRHNRTYNSPAGLNKMQGIVAALGAAGYPVTVVSPVLFGQLTFRLFRSSRERLGNSEVIYPMAFDVPVLGILCTIFSTFAALAGLKRSGGLDRIIFYNFVLPTAVPAYLARIFLGIPIVVEYEDGLFVDPDIPWTKRVISLFLENVGRFLVSGGILVSTGLATRLRTSNVCVCRGFFKPVTLANEYVGPVKTIIFSGRYDLSRGIDIFLEAISRLQGKARVVVTGYGPLDQWVRERIAGITNVQVIKHDFLELEEYRKVLGAADIMVNPQRCETAFGHVCFPSKLYEFMSTGKVVVSSRISDIELFAQGKVILYDGDSSESLAKVLDTILGDYDSFTAFGRNARKWIEESCTYEAAGAEIMRVLEHA